MEDNMEEFLNTFHLVLPLSRGAVQQLYKRMNALEAATAIQLMYETAKLPIPSMGQIKGKLYRNNKKFTAFRNFRKSWEHIVKLADEILFTLNISVPKKDAVERPLVPTPLMSPTLKRDCPKCPAYRSKISSLKKEMITLCDHRVPVKHLNQKIHRQKNVIQNLRQKNRRNTMNARYIAIRKTKTCQEPSHHRLEFSLRTLRQKYNELLSKAKVLEKQNRILELELKDVQKKSDQTSLRQTVTKDGKSSISQNTFPFFA